MKTLLALLLLCSVGALAQAPTDSIVSALRMKRPLILRVEPPALRPGIDKDSLRAAYQSRSIRDSIRVFKGDTLIRATAVGGPGTAQSDFVNKGDQLMQITVRQWRRLNQQIDQLLQAIKALQPKKP